MLHPSGKIIIDTRTF